MSTGWFLDGEQAPPFAILSHTWEDGEVTFEDFEAFKSQGNGAQAASLGALVPQKKGCVKILKTCRQAREISHLE